MLFHGRQAKALILAGANIFSRYPKGKPKDLYMPLFFIKSLFLVFLFVSGLSEAEKQVKKSKLAPSSSTNRKPSGDRHWQARGVVLSFHEWPDENESRQILAYTSSQALTKLRASPSQGLSESLIQRLGWKKKWIFIWADGLRAKSVGEAYKICFDFPEISSLFSCEPDYLDLPDFLNHLKNKWRNKIGGRFAVPEESSVSSSAPSSQRRPSKASSQPETGNFHSCGIIQKRHLLINQDFYYGSLRRKDSIRRITAGSMWAQEMIGADLLREELKKKLLTVSFQQRFLIYLQILTKIMIF